MRRPSASADFWRITCRNAFGRAARAAFRAYGLGKAEDPSLSTSFAFCLMSFRSRSMAEVIASPPTPDNSQCQ